MAAVRGRVEQDVVGSAFNAAFEHGFQRLVAGVIAIKRQIIAENQEAERRVAQPVSYTHLDVYKRQHQHRGSRRHVRQGG